MSAAQGAPSEYGTAERESAAREGSAAEGAAGAGGGAASGRSGSSPASSASERWRSSRDPSAASAENPNSSSGGLALTPPGSEKFMLENIERRRVNVAAGKHRKGKLSPLWQYMICFEPALESGKNVLCGVLTAAGKQCGHLMKYISKNGTGAMTNHMKRNHKELYDVAMAASAHSSAAQQERGQVLAGASAPAGAAQGPAAGGGEGSGKTLYSLFKGDTPTLTSKDRDRLNRKLVLWCVLNGRPWTALDDVGFKLLLAEFSPGYAVTTPLKVTLDKILADLYSEVQVEVTGVLKSLHEGFRKIGHPGGFCSLQLDLTTVANQEFCTASASVLLPDSTEVEHISLATTVFPGTHKEADVARWIEELTEDTFGSFIDNLQPRDVFVAATVDQGGNVVNACKYLDLPVHLCRAHRINSAVMWMLGIAGSTSTCKNTEMKDLIQRAAALVGVFSHSAVNNEALRLIQAQVQRQEMKDEVQALAEEAGEMGLLQDETRFGLASMTALEGGAVDMEKITFDILNLLRRNDTRWASQLAFLVRLIILERYITEYLRDNPQNARRGLAPTDWLVMKEVCCVLEYAKRVTVGIQGGDDGLLSRSIYLCNELVDILAGGQLEIVDFKKMREAKEGDEPLDHDIKRVEELQAPVQKAVSVGLKQLKDREVHLATTDMEILALYLDPRYKMLDLTVCGNGDVPQAEVLELRLRAKAALVATGKAMDAELVRAEARNNPGAVGSSAAGPVRKRPRNMFEQREANRTAAIERATGRQQGASDNTVSARLGKEIVAYDHIPPCAAAHLDVIGYWRCAGKAVFDKDGVLIEGPKFPLLSALARVYLCVDSTSCQSERDFSVLATTLNKLRRGMDPDRVRKMMYLRLDSSRIAEIKSINTGMAKIATKQAEGRKQAAKAQEEGAGQLVNLALDGDEDVVDLEADDDAEDGGESV